jgi:hypothetical protein
MMWGAAGGEAEKGSMVDVELAKPSDSDPIRGSTKVQYKSSTDSVSKD